MRLWQQSMISLARNGVIKNFMQSRAAMSDLAERFVGGKDITEAGEKSLVLKSQGYLVSLFYLGEYVEDPDVVSQTVCALKAAAIELEAADLDLFICADPTQIGYQISGELCRNHAFEIAQQIKAVSNESVSSAKNFLMLDMEDSSVTEATIGLYTDLVDASLPAALTLQAYLYRTKNDLKTVVMAGGAVRLVKGAFAERDKIAFVNRSQIDDNYLQLAEIMLSEEARKSFFYPIFATHDGPLIRKITEMAHLRGWSKGEYEIEMLYGVRVDLQRELVQSGERVRLYLPFGEEWWPYAVRRVGESPKNARFLLRALSRG